MAACASNTFEMCLISFIIHDLFQLSFPPPKTFLLTLTLSALVTGSSNAARTTGYTTVLNVLIAAIKASSPRYAAVLQLTADKAGWGKPSTAGRARGIALHRCFGSIVAQVAEVSLTKGQIRVHGVVQEGNFPTNPMVSLGQAPQVETHIVASNGYPAGVGEPAVPPIAPAVGNALFAFTGKRPRTLPLVV